MNKIFTTYFDLYSSTMLHPILQYHVYIILNNKGDMQHTFSNPLLVENPFDNFNLFPIFILHLLFLYSTCIILINDSPIPAFFNASFSSFRGSNKGLLEINEDPVNFLFAPAFYKIFIIMKVWSTQDFSAIKPHYSAGVLN